MTSATWEVGDGHELAAKEIAALDPHKFMAVIGKRVIHPGGPASTQSLLHRACIADATHVHDVARGFATTAVASAKRSGGPVMLESATANARAAGVAYVVTVEEGAVAGTRPS